MSIKSQIEAIDEQIKKLQEEIKILQDNQEGLVYVGEFYSYYRIREESYGYTDIQRHMVTLKMLKLIL